MTSPLRRRFRHARRVLGYGFLVLLILLATGVGALNQLLPLVERHPDKVANWLSERLGEPVAFESARGEWTRKGPRFTLGGLRIGEGERQLEVGHAELLVAVYSGLLPGEPLTALKVRDLSLVLEQGEDRRWRMAGLPFQPDPANDSVSLEIGHGDQHPFIYQVQMRGYFTPSFALGGLGTQELKNRRYYRAEVHLSEGSQNYDLVGYSKEQIINDILDQYERHMQFLHLVR